MIRLFLIEWIKLRNYRAFQILTGLYFLVVALVCSGGTLLLEFVKRTTRDYNIDPTLLPVYDFPDVWQNVVFVAARLKILLAFIVIISITNEISYKTLRQNIIDGLSRTEFLLSKLLMILAFAVVNTVWVFLCGLINGLIYSHDLSLTAIFGNMQFLGGFFLNVFAFLLLAFFVGLLIKRTGIVIVFLGIYAVFLEPFTTLILTQVPKIPEYLKTAADFFPVKAIRDVLPNPFPKYIFHEVQDYISFADISIVSIWMLMYVGFIYLLLKWRNNN